MALKIPPPLLFLIALGMIVCLPQHAIIPLWCSVIFFIIGLIIAFLSLYAFYRAKTTIHPKQLEQTSVLVTQGIYRFSRNPMYLSLVCWLMAWSIMSQRSLGILVIWLFMLYLTHFQIQPEEKILTEKFGQQFLAYKKSVRRWI
ncbi:methyltransferase family protein [Pasteurellaceae bacterium 22721_9_1]